MFVHRGKGFGGESEGLGMQMRGPLSWGSDPRGGSEMGFAHRGKGFRGESGGPYGALPDGSEKGMKVGNCSQRKGVRR